MLGKSWITTLLGILVILGSVASCFHDGRFDAHCLIEVLAGIGLMAAKDKRVTGGSVPASPEAVVRVEAGVKALDSVAVERVEEKK